MHNGGNRHDDDDDNNNNDNKLTDLITVHITETCSHMLYPLFKVTCFCTYACNTCANTVDIHWYETNTPEYSKRLKGKVHPCTCTKVLYRPCGP